MQRFCDLRSLNICSTIIYMIQSGHSTNSMSNFIARPSNYLLQPGESKTSPSLPPLMYLVTLPLSTVPPDSPQYARYLAAIFSVILYLFSSIDSHWTTYPNFFPDFHYRHLRVPSAFQQEDEILEENLTET
jgi:hypothetical protein